MQKVIWADNFSYAYLRRLFEVALPKFEMRLLGDGLSSDAGSTQIFIRHDVDVSIDRALALAEFQAIHGVRATYMFMPHSRLYDVRRCASELKRFVALGHEVALHFDVDDELRTGTPSADELIESIERDATILAEISGESVRSISFHRPMPQLLRGASTISGLVNAYSAELMNDYLSDSRGQWRSGEPLPHLVNTESKIVQLLIHPIWWGSKHESPADRLEKFFVSMTAGLDDAERSAFDASLAFTVPAVKRINKGN